jgi:hypothetical protein
MKHSKAKLSVMDLISEEGKHSDARDSLRT